MKNAVINHPRMFVTVILLIAAIVIRLTAPMYFIGSGSMEPTLPVRTMIIVQPVKDLQFRDVVTFQLEGNDHLTAHTFIGYDENGNVLTKGDANPTPDVHNPPLTVADLKGKVVYALTPKRMLGLLIVLALIVMFVVPARLGKDEKTDQSDNDSENEPATPNEQSNPTDTTRVTTPA